MFIVQLVSDLVSRSHLLEARDQLNKRVNNQDAQGVAEILNKTNPKIMADLPLLKAELLLLDFYSKILQGQDSSELFEFASSKVTPVVKDYPELEKSFELLLGLMLVQDPVKNILSDRVAKWKANLLIKCKAALRKSESISLEPKLIKLLKLMKWMEARLGEKVRFPRMVNLENGVLELPKPDEDYALFAERLTNLQRGPL